MGSVGDCYDNAVCETFHASLKKERIYRQSWPTRAQARAAVFEYIEGWYNPRRRHSTLAYLSPTEFERQHLELAQRALEASISETGAVASTSPSASDGLTTRRISTVGVDFAANGPDLSRRRPRHSNRSRSGRDGRRSRDERQRVASPTCSHGASSLIQTSTTTAKTCRPNRGRSKVVVTAGDRQIVRSIQPAAADGRPAARRPVPRTTSHQRCGDLRRWRLQMTKHKHRFNGEVDLRLAGLDWSVDVGHDVWYARGWAVASPVGERP